MTGLTHVSGGNMDLPKLCIKPKSFQSTFLTDAINAAEVHKQAVTERRREFVKEMLSKAAQLSQDVLDRDLNAIIATEIEAGVIGMQQWMDAKIRMTEEHLKKIEKEADKSWYGEDNLVLVGEIRQEMDWFRARIAELGRIRDGFMREKGKLDDKKREIRTIVARLNGYLKQITVENLRLYSETGISPVPSQSTPLLPKRVSVTPELGPLLRSSEVSTVSRLKGTIRETQRSVSVLRSKVREQRSRSPAAQPKISGLERFFRDCLSLYTGKHSLTPPKIVSSHSHAQPLLRSKSSTRVPPSTASPLKSTLGKAQRPHTRTETLHQIAGNPNSVTLLAYFTFHKAA